MRPFVFSIFLLAVAAVSYAAPPAATLLYITDAHEVAPVVDRLGERGGIARLKTVVDEVRRQDPEAKLLFGGDLAGGVLFGAVFRGLSTVEALNRVGVDLATFGQHDFDFGAGHTKRLITASRFPWFTSNLVDRGTGEPFAELPQAAVLDAHGLRIGLIGLTGAMETSSAGEAVEQLDLLEAASAAVEQLASQRVDAIVALTQAPLEVNESILEKNPGIDAVLSEERSELHSAVWYAGDRPIASPGGNLASVVRLELTKNENGSITKRVSVLPLDSSVSQDPALKALSDSLMQALEDSLAVPVAEALVPIESGMYSDARARWGECNAGDLIADAFREWYGADIGLIQGGGIRASLPAGTITMKSVLSLLPFNNRVVMVEMTGEELRSALEQGVSAVEERSGRFLQVSGVHYHYDPSKSAGSRLLSVSVHGEALAPKRIYTVALPEYLRRGGEGYTQFSDAPLRSLLEIAPTDAVALERHLKRMGRVNTKIEGRIVRHEAEE